MHFYMSVYSPVFPLVGSINVSPGLIRPDFSASSIIRLPIRSLTEPPALKNSHLATKEDEMEENVTLSMTCQQRMYTRQYATLQ